MRGGGIFNLVVSGGSASTETLVLLQVQVMGLSVGDSVTALTGMLAAVTLFLVTSTSLDRQSATLL